MWRGRRRRCFQYDRGEEMSLIDRYEGGRLLGCGEGGLNL